MGSDSSPGYMRKVKTPKCENVALVTNPRRATALLI